MSKYRKAYFIFGDSENIMERGLEESSCVVAPERIIASSDGLKRIGAISIESVVDNDISESMFSRKAEAYLEDLLNRCSDRKIVEKMGFGGISIVETNTAPIALYYLRKAYFYNSLAESALDSIRPVSIEVDDRSAAFGDALIRAAHKRGIVVDGDVDNAENKTEGLARVVAWYAREMVYGLKNIMRPLPEADTLFICNVARQYESLEPVIRELIECKKDISVCVVTRCKMPMRKRIMNERVKYIDWKRIRRPLSALKMARTSRTAVRSWRDITSTRKNIEDVAGDALDKWFDKRRRASLRALHLADIVIDRVNPSVVVVADVADHEVKSFTAVARKRGSRSFCVQYGALSLHDSEWNFFEQDVVGVLDSANANIIKELGVTDERVVVTGNPRFDSYHRDEDSCRRVRDELRIPDDKRVIAFFSIPPSPRGIGMMESYLTEREHDDLVSTVYGLVSDDKNMLLVKPHPEEDDALHRRFFNVSRGNASRIRLVNCYSSYDLINAADVVVTAHSTTGVEAIYLDKPLITVNLTGRPDYDDYASSGAALSVRTATEMNATVEEVLNGNARLILSQSREEYRKRNPSLSNARSSAELCASCITNLFKKGSGL